MSVTIAIPFYNAEKYLSDAIKSVFAQTHQDWELILIDDGSTDDSLKIAQSVKDPRVRVFSDGENKKLPARLNEITKLAKYDIIARMDADDFMSPYRIETQYEILNNRSDLDLVSTGLYSVLNDRTLVGYRGRSSDGITFNEIINKKKGIVHASVMARKSWHERNPYDETVPISQDFDLWIRTSNKNDLKIKIISDPLYIYREEGNVVAAKLWRFYRLERSHYIKYFDTRSKRIVFKIKSYAKTTIVFLLEYTIGLNYLFNRRSDNTDAVAYSKDLNSIFEIIDNVNVSGLI